jgi:hypothetical protein
MDKSRLDRLMQENSMPFKSLSTIAALSALLALLGCGSKTAADFVSTTVASTTIVGGAATVLAMTGNTFSVSFPANTFTKDTAVIISTEMSPASAADASDPFLQYYPTPTKQLTDLISGLVVNTPVDRSFNQDITVRFSFFDEAARTPGDQYLLYRFDFDNLVWNRWGNIAATVDGGGRTATVVLPSTGLRGFIGVIALFKDLLVTNQSAYTPTTIHGKAVDELNAGIVTDVGLYFYVGTILFPVNLPASSGARIPLGGTYRNTLTTDAGGVYTFTVPDYLVGQQVNLELGREDENRLAQRRFNILNPISPNVTDSRNFENVEALTIRYGVNNLVSMPVMSGTATELPIEIPEDLI